MKLTPWLVLLCMCLAACSGSKSAQKVGEDSPQIELSDADEYIEEFTDPYVTEDSPVVEDSYATTMNVEEASPEVMTDPTDAPVLSYDAGSMREYTVQKNETLMLIAFKLYGDYEKWKDLANTNSSKLNGTTNLTEGMVLQYMAPAEEFVWNPEGLPYLIRTGDTLGGISKNVYATVNKWKSIWDNNRPLIKDPNKIYAGFTIYYLENGREVASEF